MGLLLYSTCQQWRNKLYTTCGSLTAALKSACLQPLWAPPETRHLQFIIIIIFIIDGDVAQLVVRRTDTSLTQVRLPGEARDFSPKVNFQSRFCYSVRTPSCVVVCIYICGHIKDPVVHVRIRWIMETLKQLACTVGWVARLCRCWLSPGKATRISYGRTPNETNKLYKMKR